jgi:hypothetical protein
MAASANAVREARMNELLQQLLAAIRFELVCPGTFDFKRAEEAIRQALEQQQEKA